MAEAGGDMEMEVLAILGHFSFPCSSSFSLSLLLLLLHIVRIVVPAYEMVLP